MLKNYNYVLTILTYPFIMVLSYLKLINYIKSEWYTYLILAMMIIFIPSFIMSLYSAAEDILNNNRKWRIILLILFSIIYLPVYYTKYVAKEEKYLGYLLLIISIPLSILTIKAINRRMSIFLDDVFKNRVVVNENYVYYSSDYSFSIGVDKSFRCKNRNIGDYVISCDRLEDDSFIGIYKYNVTNDNEEDIEEKLNFHIEQTIGYIEELEYDYELIDVMNDNIIQIDYNENSILITQSNYEIDDNKYSLIIIKEVPKENIDYEEYQKMIDSVSFLNYNERVSS